MVSKHLSKGSEKPPRVEGKLRLYGMRFCPFVQRIRLVLEAKGLPYDEVFVCLKNKPEWLFELNAQGKVPVLDTGDKVLAESLDIADYLDDKYPEPPLYPVPSRKAEDKELIEKYTKVSMALWKAVQGDAPEKIFDTEFQTIAEEVEKALIKRGTTFFSGQQPGMVDLMIWPSAERSSLPAMLKEKKFDFPNEKYPKLLAWREAMAEKEVVKKTAYPVETHLRFAKNYFLGNKAEYLDDEF